MRAGKIPNKIPIPQETTMPRINPPQEKKNGKLVFKAYEAITVISEVTTKPPIIPKIPPSDVRNTDSKRNCVKMFLLVAPKALRSPISRVR